MSIGYIKDNDTGAPNEYSYSVNLNTINSYTPKNNKCFCYPYNKIIIENNCGGRIVLKPELFDGLNRTNHNISIMYSYIVSANPSLFAFVKNYRKIPYNFDCCIAFNNFPAIPFSYELYSNWLAQNKNAITMNYINRDISMVSSLVSENVGGIVSGAFGMLSDYAKQSDLKNRGSVMNGIPQGNEILYSGGAGIFISQEIYKIEYIVMIDEFFNHYGYLVNETKVPTFHKRPNFDYIKTRDINIVGDIPQEDIEELENIFNDGVTVWHNINTYGDYNVNNAPT